MRGGKNTLWEGGTRVNGIVRGPGLQKVGVASSLKVHATDWVPTLVSMASGRPWTDFIAPDEPPYLLGDGLDVWQGLATGDASQSPRDWLVLETHPRNAGDRVHGDAYIKGDFKILKYQYSPSEENGWHPPPGQDPTQVSYQLGCPPPPANGNKTAAQCSSEWCLFNVTADPCEQNDLAGEYPEVVAQLVAQLGPFMDTAVPELVPEGPQPLVLPLDSGALVWAPTDGPCISDSHCSRNGVCVAATGLCACAPGWAGPHCSALNLLPVDPSEGFNRLAGGTSSWGGSPVFSEEDGLWHLIYSTMLEGCTLSEWETNSACWHATSTAPEGPYANESQVLAAFTHNCLVRRAPDKTFLLYHIGDGNEAAGVKNCTKGGAGAGVTGSGAAAAASGGGGVGYNTLSYSLSIWGPWTPIGHAIINGTGGDSDWDGSITNLAPWPLADGSVLVGIRGKNTSSRVERIGIAFAPSWRGPYTKLVDRPIFPVHQVAQDKDITGEDPFVWVDAGNVAHMLFHVCCGSLSPLNASFVGRHAFTPVPGDFTQWSLSLEPAYTTAVSWSNGTSGAVERRERPQLAFDAASGKPLVLFNGVVVGADGASFTMAARVATS